MSVPVVTQVLVAASGYDLTDLQTVKDELQITGPDDDATIMRWITAVSTDCRNFCNRPFQVETVRDLFQPQRDGRPVTGGGVMPLQLTRWPVTSRASPAGIAAPLAPALTEVSGGALAARKYFVTVTYVTSLGETAVSAEAVLAVPAGSLLQVASPLQDAGALATGWNVYVGTASGAGTLQNASPLAIGAAFTEPAGGLVAGAAQPAFTAVIEDGTPLAENVDFLTDAAVGQLTRLDASGRARKWPGSPITATYEAGYAAVPAEVADAAIRLVKHRWFARLRDPFLKSENIPGVYEATYWIASGPGSSGNLPPDVQDTLGNYRVPVAV